MLFVAPSAVSRQIQRLEQELGVDLLERNIRGAIPTQAGQMLLQHIRNLKREDECLRSRIDALKKLESGEIRIAMGGGYSADLISSALESFCHLYPGVTFDLSLSGTGKIIQKVHNDEADIGLVFDPSYDPHIESLNICCQPLYLITRGDVVLCITAVSEWIGTAQFNIAGGRLTLLPMLYAVLMGLLVTPDLLGRLLKPLRSLVSRKEVEVAGSMVMMALLPLGVKYGTLVGPNIEAIAAAGPALVLQELGNLATVVIAMPLALLLGMKREAIGACSSICREPSLGVIGERYGMNSAEGTGVLGIYLAGSVLGTIYFSVLGSFAPQSGLHPFALAMGSGIGSGSMMAAASASLSAAVPELANEILAYAATSNMLTGLTGMYALIFLAMPLTNFMYNRLEPILGRAATGGKKKPSEAAVH